MKNSADKQTGMKVLVLGGDGMLGHQLVRVLSPFFNLKTTLRSKKPHPEARDLFTSKNADFGIDVLSQEALKKTLKNFSPDVVVNAVGIVKQRHEAIEAIPCISVNALFPHRLQQITESFGCRVIHLSTDCVFSGRKGNYAETDVADAEDLYGRSKLLGEITTGHALTLRTSMIGREMKRKKSLLEWFLKQKGKVPGYTKAIFSGLTTLELARIIHMLIVDYPRACGLYHVSGMPINKFDLLHLINNALKLDIDIVPDETVIVNRSLDATIFQRTFDYSPPSWETMIAELALQKGDDKSLFSH